MPWDRPFTLDADLIPFWDGLKNHEFLLMQCKRCGAWYFPAAYCRNHDNEPYMEEMVWARASGRGTVAAYNVHYRAFVPEFKDDLPYVFALAQLEEGPMFGTTIQDVDPKNVYVGMPVRISYDDRVEDLGVVLPRFRTA